MERSLSQEERIRRAEEIYFNRRGISGRVKADFPTKEEKRRTSNLRKKMVLQILICFCVYFIIFLIRDTNYVFSENVLKQVDLFLSHEINWQATFQTIQGTFQTMNDKINRLGGQMSSNENAIEGNATQENQIVEEKIEEQEKTEENSTEEQTAEENGIGGGIEESQATNLSQMEIDEKYIKENYSCILPVEGVITSRFGEREATEIVSANHCGTDIGAETGVEIKSIMDGKVTLVSTEGDYGKHIKIENGEVSVLYAHCSELDVTEGQEVKQGDLIAKVGSTGKATGPHLHIEIKREDRYIDPEMVLPF